MNQKNLRFSSSYILSTWIFHCGSSDFIFKPEPVFLWVFFLGLLIWPGLASVWESGGTVLHSHTVAPLQYRYSARKIADVWTSTSHVNNNTLIIFQLIIQQILLMKNSKKNTLFVLTTGTCWFAGCVGKFITWIPKRVNKCIINFWQIQRYN